MSDCANGGRSVYLKPDGEGVMRVRFEFDVHGANMLPDWDYAFELNGRTLVGITVNGERWAPERTCTMRRVYAGYPCHDWKCSACGKIHNSLRAGQWCPRCGAHTVRVVDKDGRRLGDGA